MGDSPITRPIVWNAHGKHAQAVRFAQSGELLVSTGQDAAIRLWSVPDFEPVGVIEGHDKSVNSLSLPEIESMLATGSSDFTVRVWSFPDGELLHTLEKQVSAAFSRDGFHLATIPPHGSVVVWDPETGMSETKLALVDTRVFAVSFSHDGAELLIGGTGAVHRVSLPTGEKLGTLRGHEIAVPSLAVSPDGTILASTGADGTLRCWSTEEWRPLSVIQLEERGIYQLAFHPEGDRVAVSQDHLIQVLSVPDGEEIGRFEVEIKGVYGVAISHDGRFLANAGADGKIRIWELDA